MRGFDRDQVLDYLRRVEAELHVLAADRDAATANAEELATHLAEARNEVASLRHEVDALSVPPTSVSGMSDRLTRMLQLATDEASEIRATATAEADELRSVVQQEVEELRGEAEAAAAKTEELARQNADQMVRAAEARAAEIAAEADRLAEELAQRRQAMEAEHAKTMAAARAEADRIVAAAGEQAAVLAEQSRRQAGAVRETTEELARTRLARSRDLAVAARYAHTQVIDHLAALRDHLDSLPGALAFDDEDAELISRTDAEDLELLNRTLPEELRFGSEASAAPADPTAVAVRDADEPAVDDAAVDEAESAVDRDDDQRDYRDLTDEFADSPEDETAALRLDEAAEKDSPYTYPGDVDRRVG